MWLFTTSAEMTAQKVPVSGFRPWYVPSAMTSTSPLFALSSPSPLLPWLMLLFMLLSVGEFTFLTYTTMKSSPLSESQSSSSLLNLPRFAWMKRRTLPKESSSNMYVISFILHLKRRKHPDLTVKWIHKIHPSLPDPLVGQEHHRIERPFGMDSRISGVLIRYWCYRIGPRTSDTIDGGPRRWHPDQDSEDCLFESNSVKEKTLCFFNLKNDGMGNEKEKWARYSQWSSESFFHSDVCVCQKARWGPSELNNCVSSLCL